MISALLQILKKKLNKSSITTKINVYLCIIYTNFAIVSIYCKIELALLTRDNIKIYNHWEIIILPHHKY